VRILEAIVTWNQRATSGEQPGARPGDQFVADLPLIALTCIDPRLNPFFPSMLGLREEQFIWLRNAGNVITSTTSSTMRSLALACAVKGGREIVIIGHSDCGVRRTNVSDLVDRLRAVGVSRDRLPDDIAGFFGLFASERQNVMRSAEHARRSPLVGAAIPVHGLLIDTCTGRLEWVVNGYQSEPFATATLHIRMTQSPPPDAVVPPQPIVKARKPPPGFRVSKV
jgi:carbonic anhydrase